MASNKERIETNNTRLSAISTQLDDLPPKVNLDATTITPGIENQVISSGTYLSGDLTVLGDSDLVAENIKQGVNIFGVDGTFDNSNGQYVWKKYEMANKQNYLSDLTEYFVENITDYPFTVYSTKTSPSANNNNGCYTLGGTITENEVASGIYSVDVTGTTYFTVNNTVSPFFVGSSASGTTTLKFQIVDGRLKISASSGKFRANWYSKSPSETIGYYISDNPTAYPDGGEQGGYWYEKVIGVKYGVFYNRLNSAGYPIDAEINFPTDITGNSGFYVQSYPENLSIKYCNNFLIKASKITNEAFKNYFIYFSGKLKLKDITLIGLNAFEGIGAGGSRARIWIPKSCETIYATSYNNGPFFNGNNTNTIYCEATSQPKGWGSYWNYHDYSNILTAMWGVTEEQFDAL